MDRGLGNALCQWGSSQVEVQVRVWVSLVCLSQKRICGSYQKKEENHHHVPLSCLRAEQRSTSPWNDTGLKSYFVFFVCVWPVKNCLLYTVMDYYWILCLPPQISGEGLTILNSHFLDFKAHTQCCSHCLNFSKEHKTMATVLHWQNIVLIWDTHKGESDPNTRQLRISKCETDIPARYNIEQLKGCNKYLFKSI